MKKKKIVITGLVGFMGSHLRDRLSREQDIEVPPFEDAYFSQPEKLREVLVGSDTVVHLAAMNRGDEQEIYTTNIELVNKLTAALDNLNIRPHVIFSSSTQATLDNSYGRSKKEGARLLEIEVGLLINFGGSTLKEGLHRVVNNYIPSASSRLRVNQR